MHESRMIAEVAPPGVCAMPKVSGSRIATPFAAQPGEHADDHAKDRRL